VFASNAYALFASTAGLAALVLLQRLKPSEARWVFLGACGLGVIAVAWRLGTNLEFTDAVLSRLQHPLVDTPRLELHARRHRTHRSRLAGILAGAMRRGRTALLLLGGLVGAGCVASFPQTWKSWTTREFPPQQLAGFSGFRERIPPGADVFLGRITRSRVGPAPAAELPVRDPNLRHGLLAPQRTGTRAQGERSWRSHKLRIIHEL